MTRESETAFRTDRVFVLVIALLAPTVVETAQKVTKHSITAAGQARTYYRFIPETGAETPLVILLHGSGRDGTTLIQPWQSLARKESFALAAPDSIARDGWSLAKDGPEFLRDIVDAVRAEAKIDGRRVYLFGHSAGGHHAIDLALLESEFLAAAAVHAGALTHNPELMTAQADRKIPIGMWNGTDDRIVPIAAVRQSRDFLVGRGFDVKLTELARHTHDYYGRSSEINQAAWKFLEAHRLNADPKYKPYVIGK